MKTLSFLVKEFSWKAHQANLGNPEKLASEESEKVTDALVVFFHAEAKDQEDPKRCFKYLLKHVKWLANKRGFKQIVFHSFAHLGGETAEAGFAQSFLAELEERLIQTGYQVKHTPFGYFCEWKLDVYGESLAKVWKEL